MSFAKIPSASSGLFGYFFTKDAFNVTLELKPTLEVELD